MAQYLGGTSVQERFKHGNVTRRNTRVGDTVYYITSPERGNTSGRHTCYSLVKVMAFKDERILVRQAAGRDSHVKAWHLFTRSAIERTSVQVNSPKLRRDVRIIPQSTQVRRDSKGAFLVRAFVTESGQYETLVRFTGAGKLKRAKEWEASVRATKRRPT